MFVETLDRPGLPSTQATFSGREFFGEKYTNIDSPQSLGEIPIGEEHLQTPIALEQDPLGTPLTPEVHPSVAGEGVEGNSNEQSLSAVENAAEQEVITLVRVDEARDAVTDAINATENDPPGQSRNEELAAARAKAKEFADAKFQEALAAKEARELDKKQADESANVDPAQARRERIDEGMAKAKAYIAEVKEKARVAREAEAQKTAAESAPVSPKIVAVREMLRQQEVLLHRTDDPEQRKSINMVIKAMHTVIEQENVGQPSESRTLQRSTSRPARRFVRRTRIPNRAPQGYNGRYGGPINNGGWAKRERLGRY